VTLVQADMRTFDLGRRFERILLPYNALYCLLREEDVSRCLRAVRLALEPGGIFAFDVWCSDGLDVKDLRDSRDDEPLTQFEHAGRSWSVFERCEVARGRDRLDVVYTYVPSGAANARQQTLAQRYYRSDRLFALLERAGFEVLHQYGTFGGARFGPRSRRLVVTASPVARAAR
jgi:hypothetical protein